MTVIAECEICGHKWEIELKPCETFTCPNCKTVYDALIVVNDPENKETMRIVTETQMTETQTKKQKFRTTSTWKNKKNKEKARAKNLDEITLKPLRKGWQLHHNCLDEKEYENMEKSFLCCNNMTHRFIHWLYSYYKTDKQILCRIKKEMEQMKKENEIRIAL